MICGCWCFHKTDVGALRQQQYLALLCRTASCLLSTKQHNNCSSAVPLYCETGSCGLPAYVLHVSDEHQIKHQIVHRLKRAPIQNVKEFHIGCDNLLDAHVLPHRCNGSLCLPFTRMLFSLTLPLYKSDEGCWRQHPWYGVGSYHVAGALKRCLHNPASSNEAIGVLSSYCAKALPWIRSANRSIGRSVVAFGRVVSSKVSALSYPILSNVCCCCTGILDKRRDGRCRNNGLVIPTKPEIALWFMAYATTGLLSHLHSQNLKPPFKQSVIPCLVVGRVDQTSRQLPS